MSHSIPPEILDLIVDHLHNEPATLKACCIASRSWVPRVRRHFFAHVKFEEFPGGSYLELWMKAFPDPSNSPAHYARTLAILGGKLVAAASTDVGRWILAFHNVVHFHVNAGSWVENWGYNYQISLIPFHGLSPTIRSLCLYSSFIPSSETLDLVCSFPLIEDFTFISYDRENEPKEWTAPLTSPKLTGSLKLESVVGGIGLGSAVRRLLDLPNGLHFRKIVLVRVWDADPGLVRDLVLRCSRTLEFLDVTEGLLGELPHPLCIIRTLPIQLGRGTELDLSAATKLKDLVLQSHQPNVRWITRALQSVKSNGLRRITLRPDPYTFLSPLQETTYQEWWDLDRLLVQFRTSRLICPKVVYKMNLDEEMRGYALSLLPELTRRGLVDLVEYSSPQ